jgi:hypothetical protein
MAATVTGNGDADVATVPYPVFKVVVRGRHTHVRTLTQLLLALSKKFTRGKYSP